MNNEQKLKTLLTVAVKNGWKSPINSPIEECKVLSEKSTGYNCHIFPDSKYKEMPKTINIHLLMTEWEEDEISFITAISFGMYYDENPFDRSEPLQIPASSFRKDWVDIPSSERFEWLFNRFNHLF